MLRSKAIVLLGLPATRPSRTWRSRGESDARRAWTSAILPSCSSLTPSPLNRRFDRGQQDLFVEGFFEEINGAELHRLYGERHVTMASDHNDGNLDRPLLQAVQELDTADLRHSYIRDDAAVLDHGQRLEKAHGRIVGLHRDVGGAEEERKRFAHGGVIVDDMDYMIICH